MTSNPSKSREFCHKPSTDRQIFQLPVSDRQYPVHQVMCWDMPTWGVTTETHRDARKAMEMEREGAFTWGSFQRFSPAGEHNPAGEKQQNIAVPELCSTGASGLRSQRPRCMSGAGGSSRDVAASWRHGEDYHRGSHRNHTANSRKLTATQQQLMVSTALKWEHICVNIEVCVCIYIYILNIYPVCSLSWHRVSHYLIQTQTEFEASKTSEPCETH